MNVSRRKSECRVRHTQMAGRDVRVSGERAYHDVRMPLACDTIPPTASCG